MLTNHRRALAYAVGLLVATVVIFALVAFDSTLAWVQTVDDAVYRRANEFRFGLSTLISRVLNLLGSGWVLIPLRIVIAAWLAVRRRWRALTAWMLIWLVSEVAINLFKAVYERPRPPGSLVTTRGFSFPSGHAVATAATAIGLVLVLLPPGHRRRHWEVYSVVFAFVMALSRVYLNAHWLSDVVAGTLLGATIALGVAGLVTEVHDVVMKRRVRSNVPPVATSVRR
ncbi:MAG TPA: phosphatase PAP2 family protein [Actinomycetota bacterium]|nr:phosphatase PAP2 family protein [Actinomycetota bacterium]